MPTSEPRSWEPLGTGATNPAGFMLGWQTCFSPTVPCAQATTLTSVVRGGMATSPHEAITDSASPVVA